MAFIVEDGTGLENANAYIEVVFADEYFADRGIASWAALDAAVKQAAIIKATDYITTVYGGRFKGEKFNEEQALDYPRLECGDTAEAPIPLPRALQQATAEYATRAVSTQLLPDTSRDESGMLLQGKTETVGPITESVQYAAVYGIQEIEGSYPAADLKLRSLLRSMGNRVIRG